MFRAFENVTPFSLDTFSFFAIKPRRICVLLEREVAQTSKTAWR